MNYRYLIHEGRARELNKMNGTIDTARKINPEKELWIDEDGRILNDYIYVNCKGEICLDCDLSYKRQTVHKIGNILTDKLESLAVVMAE